MHIHTFISRTGYCSRRETIRLIEAGRVTINGVPCTSKQQVEAEDEIRIDGKRLPDTPLPVYLAYNKPRGVTCTAQPNVKDNIIDYINYPERIFPVGRLDKDSEGLILLTNDGSIVNPLMKKEFHREKEYIVTVDRPISAMLIQGIQEGGINIRGTLTSPCQALQLDDYTLAITLTQGLNRQIRRMCRTFDYTVQTLKRIRIGSIHLENLAVGQWRHLNHDEIHQLKKESLHGK
ncbi:pseudouridine synthase [Jeotgalibacillus sp. S-D1]|uniref:pseudouridine synthase n=1 Tax=Jeotgalibacillus sp. S-D1 TaxID=2552189 RepID=UPI00105A15C4|nr:pseudouridine synthase [Jeotgalibacillus sp. S-D1]TDL31714.1 pseudouridine synthase [Jeotgalibacillus sp. S-D1]